MSIISRSQFRNSFANQFPEMTETYDLYVPNTEKVVEYDYEPADLDDYEYQQSLY
jgi:hypothetical protein